MVNKKTSCLPSKSAALTVSVLVSLFALFATGSEDLSATTAKRSEARCKEVMSTNDYVGVWRYDSPMGAATLSGAKTTAYLHDNTPDVQIGWPRKRTEGLEKRLDEKGIRCAVHACAYQR